MSRKKGKSMLEQMRDHNAATMHTFKKVEKPAVDVGKVKVSIAGRSFGSYDKGEDGPKYGVLEGKL